MNMPFRPASDQLEIVRVPMSRALWKRLAAESILLGIPPAELIREIIIAAFTSGDFSSLRAREEPPENMRFVPVASVASASPETRNHQNK